MILASAEQRTRESMLAASLGQTKSATQNNSFRVKLGLLPSLYVFLWSADLINICQLSLWRCRWDIEESTHIEVDAVGLQGSATRRSAVLVLRQIQNQCGCALKSCYG
jgi:hypothetical protein